SQRLGRVGWRVDWPVRNSIAADRDESGPDGYSGADPRAVADTLANAESRAPADAGPADGDEAAGISRGAGSAGRGICHQHGPHEPVEPVGMGDRPLARGE